MKTELRTIPFDSQRYPTAGDWFTTNYGLNLILVSETGHEGMNFLIGIHEMIEQYLCQIRGISEESVSKFDKAHLDADDPGSLKDAPYRKEHMFALKMEKLIAKELGIDWNVYEKRLAKICDAPHKCCGDKKR